MATLIFKNSILLTIKYKRTPFMIINFVFSFNFELIQKSDLYNYIILT